MFSTRTPAGSKPSDPSESKFKKRAVAFAMAMQVGLPTGVMPRLLAGSPAQSTDPTPAPAKTVTSRDLYQKGRAEFAAGKWVDARKDLSAAKAAGFSPAPREESVDVLISRLPSMDALALALPVVLHAASAPALITTLVEPDATTTPTTNPTGIAPAEPTAATPTPTTPGTPTPVNPGTPMPAGGGAVAQQLPPQVPAEEQRAAEQVLATSSKLKQIKQQQMAYQASTLVAEANRMRSAGQINDAYETYQKALQADPTNAQAMQGRNELADQLGKNASRPANVEASVQARREQIVYLFDSALDSAGRNVTVGKFDDAQRDIERAKVARSRDPVLFTEQQLNEFDQRVRSSEVTLEQARKARESADADKALLDAEQRRVERDRKTQSDREQTVSGLVGIARQLADESRYVEALGVLDQILAIDPNNAYANSVRTGTQDKADGQTQRHWKEAQDHEFTKVLNDGIEKMVPYSDIIKYSADWPALSKMRDEEVRQDQGASDDEAVITALLDKKQDLLPFGDGTTFEGAIGFLRDTNPVNIFVDWKALEGAGVERATPVKFVARNIKFAKALDLIFKAVQQGDDDDHRLGFVVEDGVITITTRKELNKNVVVRRFDINDLLFVAPDYTNAPDLSLQNATQGQQGGQGGGGGGGGNLFGGGQNQQQQQTGADRQQRIDEIKSYITTNVDKNSWVDNGGELGTITSSPLRAILLITQTPENQHKVVSILDSLRASQALQVNIEARFLTVQRNYLEDIGVNATFNFNPLQRPGDPRSGFNSSRFSPIGVTQNQITDNTTFRDANGNVTNSTSGTRSLDWISNVGNATVPGSIAANPGDYPNPIVIQGTYLDNFTINFLIRAVQANQNTTSLTAPRLTLFSGQRAVLVVSTQQAYVSDLTPVVAPGAALFQPRPATTFANAVVLRVQATVSPDRKYVFLDLQPQIARLRALVPFTISAITTQNNGLGNPTQQVINGTFQLPTIDVTTVQTSCSVPDGATLLLGGQTLAAETVREQGVPVLSKIPILKRLFTNRATSQDEQILLILVKPTILIQREQEMKQFPQLSEKAK